MIAYALIRSNSLVSSENQIYHLTRNTIWDTLKFNKKFESKSAQSKLS